ncbi:hypothetical protein QEH56_23740 [Pelagicoccus enzymogenes]|uniref:hypothetical protein n=1 Tax=Pelagicoccus enzymogenes TaxID=2773457 RepID=UPI0028108FE0|nr:hypothetical protein [Pelagicoccus enzymogenes]MDQ8201198.1 hypothetical protein [Pelagicoccus enzymogenes]
MKTKTVLSLSLLLLAGQVSLTAEQYSLERSRFPKSGNQAGASVSALTGKGDRVLPRQHSETVSKGKVARGGNRSAELRLSRTADTDPRVELRRRPLNGASSFPKAPAVSGVSSS